MTTTRCGARILAGLAMTAALTTVTAGFVGVQAASAVPWDCSVGGSGNVGTAICRSGTGQYQAVVSCDVWLGRDYTRKGAWRAVGSGEESTAACDSSEGAYNRRFNAFGPL
ncbi:hypothetical protein AB0C12_34800 [Actinoplanes sp. NPDC048967]|uniref:hypothetical protein n=1 Tax=Actinoplanes sp. NPDC048967 TaxID=3155269 RepID=UPI0033C948BB